MKLKSFVSCSLLLLLSAPLSQAAVTYRIYATREGLVGGTTANGHVIKSRDHFCALPSGTVLNSNGGTTYTVNLYNPANGKGKNGVPVWDIGPWNIHDNYWHVPRAMFTNLPRGKSETQAAYEDNYNGGKDEFGRTVPNAAGIDLADGTFWDDLGMVNNGWIDVTFNWETTSTVKDHVEVFARGSSGTLVQKSYANNGGWGSWIDLGGNVAGGVAVCGRNPNEVLVFARGATLNNLQQLSYTTSAGWGNWVGLGGTLTSDPAAIAWGSNGTGILVFARSSTGSLIYRSYSGGTWNPWIDLGGNIAGGVAVCSRNANEVLVFARGASANNLQQLSYTTTSGWGSWVGLGGTITSDPAALARGTTKVEIFARSSSGTLIQKSYNGSWGAWIDLGGAITDGPGVTARNTEEVLVFTRGSSMNNLQQKSYTTTDGWGGWIGLGGTITSGPAAYAW